MKSHQMLQISTKKRAQNNGTGNIGNMGNAGGKETLTDIEMSSLREYLNTEKASITLQREQ